MWRWVNRRLIILIVEGMLLQRRLAGHQHVWWPALVCGCGHHTRYLLCFSRCQASHDKMTPTHAFLFMISLGWAGGRAELPEGPLNGGRTSWCAGRCAGLPPEDTVVTHRVRILSRTRRTTPSLRPCSTTPRMMVMLGDNVYETTRRRCLFRCFAHFQLAQNPAFALCSIGSSGADVDDLTLA